MSTSLISEQRHSLKQQLESLVRRGDFFTVSRARLIGYLVGVLNYQHMIVISPEELIYGFHLDPYSTKRKGYRFERRDVFTHVNRFIQLGYDETVAKMIVNDAVKRLVDAHILRGGSSSDGQCTFDTTQVIDTMPGHFDLTIERIRSLRN